jgi:hypothetical protein
MNLLNYKGPPDSRDPGVTHAIARIWLTAKSKTLNTQRPNL